MDKCSIISLSDFVLYINTEMKNAKKETRNEQEVYMKVCYKCGREFEKGDVFCPKCGDSFEEEFLQKHS